MLPKGTTTKGSKPFGQFTSKKPARRCRSEVRISKASLQQRDRDKQRKRRDHAPSPNFRLVLRSSKRLQTAEQIPAASPASVSLGKCSPSNATSSSLEKPDDGTNGHAYVQNGTKKRKHDADDLDLNQDEEATRVLRIPKRKKSCITIDAIEAVDAEASESSEKQPAPFAFVPDDDKIQNETNLYPHGNFQMIDHTTMNLDQDLYSPSCFNTLDTIWPNMGTENINDAQCDAEVAAIMAYDEYFDMLPAPVAQIPNDSNALSPNDPLPYGFTSKPYSPSCLNTTLEELPYEYNLTAYSPSCLTNAFDQLPYGYSLKPYSPTF